MMPVSCPPARPYCRQFIAITPRSGSTWWCDLLARTDAGRPAEFLNEGGIWRKTCFSDGELSSWDELHEGISRSAKNPAYDLKASWFQFAPLLSPQLERTLGTLGFPRTTWSYLTRRDLAAQAASLYLMKRTGSSHQRRGQPHPEFDNRWFDDSRANIGAIMCWLLHVAQQEYGWETFFAIHHIKPWRCAYEDISAKPIRFVRQYIRHANLGDTSSGTTIPIPRARRAVRSTRLLKFEYPAAQTESLMAAFRRTYAQELAIINEWRGKESAAALRKRCGLANLSKDEISNS
jgi:LPS sulfotransferase NodH